MSVGELDALVRPTEPSDLGEFLTLQWACFPPELHEPLDILQRDVLEEDTSFVLRVGGRLVGTVSCRLLANGTDWQPRLLMVAPDLRGRGIGRFLLEYAERAAPPSVTTYSLLTGTGNKRSQRMYTRAGYRSRGEVSPGVVRFSQAALVLNFRGTTGLWQTESPAQSAKQGSSDTPRVRRSASVPATGGA